MTDIPTLTNVTQVEFFLVWRALMFNPNFMMFRLAIDFACMYACGVYSHRTPRIVRTSLGAMFVC